MEERICGTDELRSGVKGRGSDGDRVKTETAMCKMR